MNYQTGKHLVWLFFWIAILLIALGECAEASYTDFIQAKHTVPSDRAESVAEAVKSYSDKYRVSSDLIMAIMWQESHFRNIKGPTGEAGYMQVKPATFYKVCGYRTNLDRLIYDYRENIRCGIKYLAKLQAKYGWYDGISSYNAGLPIVSNADYVIEVLQKRQKVKEFVE